MLKVGLTGGIGSGKSTVRALFAELGVPTISADDLAHRLLQPGSPAIPQLQQQFPQHLFKEGGVDRTAMGRWIFQHPAERQKLEAILHPLIYAAITDWMSTLQAPYCVLEIPLLIETRQQAFVDRVLVVDCPEADQKRRVIQSRALIPEVFDRIIQAQASREQRLQWADEVIDNSDRADDVQDRVKDLDLAYRTLGRNPD